VVIHKVVGEETEAKQVTRSDRTLASGVCVSGQFRLRCARAERANASRGTPTRPVHGCVAADAGDLTHCVSVRSR
jgi:hypothetical protein